ncbi:hypothetical protein AUI06_03625 [archaeon 13_2_20CM_2_52_21]|nr:MAG: hypothetical protein AUI06_03625 [archaeon 13_2_20CM_2_52_21]OLD07993.1 MAG: hypothetical protein AUI95_04320 [Crenarchaeota archaeon 13_1_40CM_3_52_4]
MAIVNIDNRYSTTLAMISGVMITATRLAIPQFYPSQATNGWANLFTQLSSGGLSLFAVLAGTVSFLVQFGGVSIFIGGLLCYKKHLRSGKEFVGIGTTFGFADLLLAIPSLGSSSSGPIYLVVVAWTGLFFAVFAGRHIKGPKRSYASEVRKIVTGIRSRILRQEKRKKRERRLRRRRAQSKLTKGSLSPAKQYNISGNKNSDS